MLDVGQFVCGADDLETPLLGLHLEGLALIVASGRSLREGLGAAAHRDVGPGGEQLLGDRALSALLEGFAWAVLGHLFGSVAVPLADVGEQRGRRGVLDLRCGDVAGGEALVLGEFEDRLLRFALDVDAERAVVGLGAGGPSGGAGGRVGDVVGLAVLVQRVGGVRTRQREGVDARRRSRPRPSRSSGRW